MPLAYISVGSNIDPQNNVEKALRLLAVQMRIEQLSTVYHTEPVQRPEQPWYYNCVVEISTELSPSKLQTTVLRAIEKNSAV